MTPTSPGRISLTWLQVAKRLEHEKEKEAQKLQEKLEVFVVASLPEKCSDCHRRRSSKENRNRKQRKLRNLRHVITSTPSDGRLF